MSGQESCSKMSQGKCCNTKDVDCNCKTFIKNDTCISLIDCCGDKSGVKYCICVCKCGEKVCVCIIDCEKDTPLEEGFEQLQITSQQEKIVGNSKCFAVDDVCVAVIDCCQDLTEKPKNCVTVVKCNNKVFKSSCCDGTKPFYCKSKCSDDGSVQISDCKGDNQEVPKKCVVVCDCGEGSICVNVKNNDGEKNACGKLIGAERNCECECYIDKGICVAVVKCAKNKKEGSSGCGCK